MIVPDVSLEDKDFAATSMHLVFTEPIAWSMSPCRSGIGFSVATCQIDIIILRNEGKASASTDRVTLKSKPEGSDGLKDRKKIDA